MNNEIIIIKQLPIIEEQLNLIKSEIQIKVNEALSLECTEDTVKTVKSFRTKLTKDFDDLEKKRKEVKNQILLPYEHFESIYKTCVTEIFKSADQQLKSKIDSVENDVKEQKQKEIFEYFNEYLESKNIGFINFDDIGLNITLTASKKALKEQVKTFIDRVSDDLALIETQELKSEILVEYKKSLNVSQAITTVSERHKAIAVEQEKAVKAEQKIKSETVAVEKVEAVAPPTVEEELITIAFKVTATKQKQFELRKFLFDGGYKYE